MVTEMRRRVSSFQWRLERSPRRKDTNIRELLYGLHLEGDSARVYHDMNDLEHTSDKETRWKDGFRHKELPTEPMLGQDFFCFNCK